MLKIFQQIERYKLESRLAKDWTRISLDYTYLDWELDN